MKPSNLGDKSHNEVVSNLQAKADHWHTQAHKAMALAFDLLYPKYKSDDEAFKAQFIYYKEEMKKAIEQRDELKRRVKKQALEIQRLRELMKSELGKSEFDDESLTAPEE